MKIPRKWISIVFVCGFVTASSWATTYEYDNLSRLTKVTYDDGTVIEYTYDASGNRTMKIVRP